jgi:predicted SnoaL-like aldol condensation-catalyzing enzyme
MDYETEEHYTLSCQNVQKLVAEKAVQFLFTGFVACKDSNEKKLIIDLLKSLIFVGHFEDETSCVVDIYKSDDSNVKNEKGCLIKYENDDVKIKSIHEDHNFDSIEGDLII